MANDYFNYEPTAIELNEFKMVNSGYIKPPKPFEIIKPTHGSLVLIEGNNRTIIKNNLPIPLLQHIRSKMIKNCYKKKNLKIEHII